MTLLFLALFYFFIATNTQTGWLFVLSAFLLGILGLSWFLSRRAAANLELEQSFFGDPLRGQPIRIKSTLKNRGKKAVQEARVEADCPVWAEDSPGFAWAVPRLPAGAVATCAHRLTPEKRGEHTLPNARIVCGAPFGLFNSTKQVDHQESFLVYPAIEKLPTTRSRSRLSTALGELTSPRGLGDSHSLRSVREYRPGDDLRQVHWKASAKRGPHSALLIREHHAPTPARLNLVLSNGASPEDDHLFERAVTLAASILWSAHREGLQTNLWIRAEKEWNSARRWQEQYTELARIKRQDSCDLNPLLELLGQETSRLALVSAAPEGCQYSVKFHKVFLLADPQQTEALPVGPHTMVIDGTSAEFEEVHR